LRAHAIVVLALFLAVAASVTAVASDRPTVSQVAQLSGSDLQPAAYFGSSIAVSSNTIAVAAPVLNGTTPAIYVFEEPSSGWENMTQTAKLAPISTCYLDSPLAISSDGSTIVASFQGCTSQGRLLEYGWLEVFVRPASGWQDMAKPTAVLSLQNGGLHDFVGQTVAISPGGNTIATTGYVYSTKRSFLLLFDKPSGGWVSMNPTENLTMPGTTGNPVALNGNIVAVNDQGNGYVLVYQRTPSGLQQLAILYPSTSDGLEHALAMDDNTIVAGSLTSNNGNGAAYVFTKPTTGWANATETAQLSVQGLSAVYSFSLTLALSERGIIVGGYSDSAAYLYLEPTDGWQTTSQPSVTLPSTDQMFGFAVGISGATIVVGDPTAGPKEGTVYVFEAN
jgi:hypothetical protein